MKDYTVVFETDYGVEQVSLSLGNTATLRHVAMTMKGLYPDDVGADAVVYDDDGGEYPLNW
mgnify:CR=1 FL=1